MATTNASVIIMLMVALVVSFIAGTEAMYFDLKFNSEKCLREEIHKDVLVKGEYDITDTSQTSAKVHMKVTDSNGHVLYQKEEAKNGKFAFTTDDYDMFQICFNSKAPLGIKGVQQVR